MMKLWITFVLIFAFLMLNGCSERWTGIVYPEKSNLSNFRNIGEFKSLDECRNEAIYTLKKIAASSQGDFECGLNCKGSVCKETSR